MAYTDSVRARLMVDAQQIIDRYPVARSALLPMLHLVQSEDGFVSADGIAFCAQQLGLTTAEVSAVATFYSQYKRHPNGTYTVGVCTNTLCAVMGGDAVYARLEEYLGIGHDETTADGSITLERIECNAGCDYAPVVMVNWEFFDQQTPTSAVELVDDLLAGKPVRPTRGAEQVHTFQEVSRVLAGFLDGHADEGVGAGAASLQGTLLAKRKGWTAPASAGNDADASAPASAPADASADGAGAGPGAVAAAATANGSAGSSHDAPAVPAGTSERAGTTAGKPAAEATKGEQDTGTGTTPSGGPPARTPDSGTDKSEG